MEKFNHAKVLNWDKLTDSERYHTGYLARYAEEKGWVKEWYYNRSHCFGVNWSKIADDKTERWTAYLVESVLQALLCQNKLYAFRSYEFSVSYQAKLEEIPRAECFVSAVEVARKKVEKLLGVKDVVVNPFD